MEFSHVSVLLEESINALSVKQVGIYVDGTLGGGGHSSRLLTHSENARLIGIDRDKEALAAARKRLEKFGDRVTYCHANYSQIKEILKNEGISQIDGAILDLGVSSYQLDNAGRGFSYNHDAALDMRMDRSQGKTAYDVVNGYDKIRLAKIFRDYGEEKFAERIANKIENFRQTKPVETTFELVELIKEGIPAAKRREGGHPAKRVFQAIRIEVNGELEVLKQSIQDFFDCLKPGGRLAIITFHSLEDRIVKNCFNDFCKGCTCPPDFPICVCGNKPKGRLIFKKPVIAGKQELENNSRASCAKLRVIEKLG
ncbi:MAG: 16S rRNA (cytosine(1402)-N(4))-methyltransferase RsmH [Clostridia bacterium]|nr:16S rRNA (cytosine(1402)-N(4))-methyltransferase RsmH [Clostridia bacterium]